MTLNSKPDRRAFLAYFSSIGLGSTLLPGVLWAEVSRATASGEAPGEEAGVADAGTHEELQQDVPITPEMIEAAEKIAGLSLTPDERQHIVRGLAQLRGSYAQLRGLPIDMNTFPAIVFDPVPPGRALPPKRTAKMVRSRVPVMARPGSLDELAYAPVTQLSELVRRRTVKPSELTEMYLSRLKRYDPQLHFVITLTEERARRQARQLDAEIAHGHYRGPLHGIPWGAKDLLAVKGYPTTWGAGLYRNQSFDQDATVVRRLDDAGAILVAKLTLGALAMGDIWYGERTRNPWNPATGSSGSSAGPASATAAGCVGFSIGSETNGSITSPSRTCGVSGFRPTFGRVPRTGAMALSWTTDKLGPICRSAEDCALVFAAIQGPDELDRAVKAYPFNWDARAKLSKLRVGYFRKMGDRDLFQRRNADGTMSPNQQALDFLKTLESLGMKPTEVPEPTPSYAFLDSIILSAESGAAFQKPTLSGDIRELEPYSTWPNSFRADQFVPAVEYVNANRARTRLCVQWCELFDDYDVIVSPQENTSVTNVVGTPSIVVPTGFALPEPFPPRPAAPPPVPGASPPRDSVRTPEPPPFARPVPPSTTPLPTWMYVMGPVFKDENILVLAHAFQQATDFSRRHPPLFP